MSLEGSFADEEGERSTGSPSMKRTKNDDNRNPVTLITRRVTTQESNHLIQTKNKSLIQQTDSQ